MANACMLALAGVALLSAVVIVTAAPVAGDTPIITVTDDAKVTVTVAGAEWFTSDDVQVAYQSNRLSLSDKTLKLDTTHHATGKDALGDYDNTTFVFVGANNECNGTPLLVASFRAYTADSSSGSVKTANNTFVFTQRFPCGQDIDTKQWLASDFPFFNPSTDKLHVSTFNGGFADDQSIGVSLEKCQVETQGGVPMMIYDDNMNTLIMSQFKNFKTAELYCTGHVSMGVKGTVTSVPENYEVEWIVSYGQGIHTSMMQWGDKLLANTGKKRCGPQEDEIVSNLGWWTDNGGYYHYPGGDIGNKPGGYEKALKQVYDTHQKMQIPFKHWQFDSWWYPKGDGGNSSSQNGSDGDYHWVADEFVFPSGIEGMQQYVKLPFVMHNRWFQPNNWYQKQGIAGKWTKPGHTLGSHHTCTLPLDVDTFFEYFFKQQQGYGLAVYEQDFLYDQYDCIPDLRTNATLADDWLRAMAENAAAHGLNMQYCMPYPREYLVATQFQNVVTIRGSGDYAPNTDNWKIVRHSLLAYATGALSFKDTFLSSSNTEPGGASRALGPEKSADLQTLISLLSGSIVGPGDGNTFTNKTRLMQTCRQDGRLLKADQPYVPIDRSWMPGFPSGEIGWTYTSVGNDKVYFVIGGDLSDDVSLTPADLQMEQSKGASKYIAYNWYTGETANFSSSEPFKLRKAKQSEPVDYAYWVISPLAWNGFALLGETSKFVGTSNQRISSVKTGSSDVVINIVGSSGEQVEMCIADVAGKLTCNHVTVGSSGKAVIQFA